MKKYTFYITALSLTIGCLVPHLNAMACDACEAQQPKLLQGITHGSGPTSNWDYVVVALMTVITLYSFYAMVKCLTKPAEKKHEHIKNIIINSEGHGR